MTRRSRLSPLRSDCGTGYTKRPADGCPSASLLFDTRFEFGSLFGPLGPDEKGEGWEFATLSFLDH